MILRRFQTFARSDIITLQNPHGFPQTSTPSAKKTPTSISEPAKTFAKPAAVAKVKAAVPCEFISDYCIGYIFSNNGLTGNASPYSSGMPGASLTSTSVDPQTSASTLLWDEEELMFEELSNPPKGKGKEKDLGKRRAYVRVVTSLGGGSLNLELFCEKVGRFIARLVLHQLIRL